MASVTHRTITEDIHDGTTGDKVDERTIHQIGVTVDGVFVPFLSKEGSYIDRLVQQGKDTPEAKDDK